LIVLNKIYSYLYKFFFKKNSLHCNFLNKYKKLSY
jgi:hypothetical protein